MTDIRKPEFEEAFGADALVTDSANELISSLKQRVNESFATVRDLGRKDCQPEDNPIRLLVVDDNPTFLQSMKSAASSLDLKIDIEGLDPTSKDEVRRLILQRIREGQDFDFILIDYQFEKNFSGLDILESLRPPTDRNSIDERFKSMIDPELLRLYYLPCAIVTRGGSAIDNDKYFNEKVLGAGADKVFTEKGLEGQSDSRNNQGALGENCSTSVLLRSLQKSGFNEMQVRAWTRLWQNLYDVLEYEIKKQLGENEWLADGNVEGPLKQVWDAVSVPLIKTRYASHLSMRIFPRATRIGGVTEDSQVEPWILKKIGSTDDDPAKCPDEIAWDALPVFKELLKHKAFGTGLFDHLTSDYLGDKQTEFEYYRDRRAMAAPLQADGYKLGTFFVTREKGSPFFSEDVQYFKVFVARLGLFVQQIKSRLGNHQRQIDLTDLGKDLLESESENEIAGLAVESLHKHLHLWRDEFTPNPAENPAFGGRVTLRLIAPGTTGVVRPDPPVRNQENEKIYHWTRGFRSSEAPKKITIRSSERHLKIYSQAIQTRKSVFYPDTNSVSDQENFRKSTRARMLVPIMAGEVVIGTINVEHRDPGFYGKNEKTSADFELVKAIALEVGQALHALRARRMHGDLLKLHIAMEESQDPEVINRLVSILYGYTACAAALWLEPRSTIPLPLKPGDARKLKVVRVWECLQDYPETAGMEFNQNQISEKAPERVEQWEQDIGKHFDRTLIFKVLGDPAKRPFYYTEVPTEFTCDTSMGIHTDAEAILALEDPESEEKALLGMFVLLFNQKPALNETQQRPVLEYVARFAASYLSIRRKNRHYFANSQIAQQQAAVGEAYQQLRHAIKMQLGGINGLVDRLSVSLQKMQLPDPDSPR